MDTWNKFLSWFATSWIASALRVALGYLLATMVAKFVEVGTFDFTDWKSWVIGAIAIATPIILRALNPADPAYGVNKVRV